MTRIPIKAALATVAFGALLGGCATTMETGPGYYHYDTGLARPSNSPAVYQEPTVTYREAPRAYNNPPEVYQEPGVTYREAPGAYNNPPVVIYDQPRLPYRSNSGAFTYQDHGQ
jgi:hypothetical protein